MRIFFSYVARFQTYQLLFSQAGKNENVGMQRNSSSTTTNITSRQRRAEFRAQHCSLFIHDFYKQHTKSRLQYQNIKSYIYCIFTSFLELQATSGRAYVVSSKINIRSLVQILVHVPQSMPSSARCQACPANFFTHSQPPSVKSLSDVKISCMHKKCLRTSLAVNFTTNTRTHERHTNKIYRWLHYALRRRVLTALRTQLPTTVYATCSACIR